MYTIVIGVRHRNAPIEIREKVSFLPGQIADALREMMTLPAILEGAILTTCNRTEIYATVTDTERGIQALKTFLSDYKGFDCDQYRKHLFILMHEDAVLHLFRVASGLDSLVLGEGQIMAQVKEALKYALQTHASGELIDKIFKAALSVGKAVRSETGITNRDISVSRAAFEFACQRHPEFLNGKIALIGAGKMAEILMSSLKAALPSDQRSPEQIILVNRTPDKVNALSTKYGFPGYGMDELPRVIEEYDTLFVATSSPHYVIHAPLFENLAKSKVIIDISVPRNVDPVVGENPNIQLYNTDNLTGFSGYSGDGRTRLMHQANLIIEREYQRYHQWLVSRSAIPMITRIREHIEDIRRHEVAKIQASYQDSGMSSNFIDELTRTLVNKIMHDPTVKLRQTPQLEEIFLQAQLLSSLFNIPHTATGISDIPLMEDTPRRRANVVSLPLGARN